ncbi:hypothetical protein EP837_03195 [Sphingobium sp. EP60837]|nr:hypothetical protein EP837_03195 [Sphingobium sp. EP60837]
MSAAPTTQSPVDCHPPRAAALNSAARHDISVRSVGPPSRVECARIRRLWEVHRREDASLAERTLIRPLSLIVCRSISDRRALRWGWISSSALVLLYAASARPRVGVGRMMPIGPASTAPFTVPLFDAYMRRIMLENLLQNRGRPKTGTALPICFLVNAGISATANMARRASRLGVASYKPRHAVVWRAGTPSRKGGMERRALFCVA